MIGCSLYRFYDAADRLLYVGITSVGPSRWVGHEANKAWWALVVRTTVEHFEDRTDAARAERLAIRTEQPLFNVVHMTERTPKGPRIRGPRGAGTVIHRDDERWAFIARINGKQRWFNTRTEGEARLLQACYEHRGVSRLTRDKAIAMLTEGSDFGE